MNIIIISIVWIAIFIGLSIFISLLFRIVVPTNEVHIVQTKKRAIPYGKDYDAWNVYYNLPSWIPFIWITRTILPVSNFTISLDNYQAYDNWKVPFWIDIKSFFRVKDAASAAKWIENFEELKEQLTDIVKGAIRKILASKDIEEIMVWRWEFWRMFTDEIKWQLPSWWVEIVKEIELMDIRDGEGSHVISDIQMKKQATIEKEKRVKVAEESKIAKIAEIEASKEAELKEQDAERQVWEKTAETTKLVWIAKEKSQQEINEEAKYTKAKEMAVKLVENVKQAEIEKSVAVVAAQKEKQTSIVKADWEKQQTITIAEWKLQEQQKSAEWIQAIWLAKAEAEKAMLLAPVKAQIELAEKIADMPEYINYLETIKALEVEEEVWTAKAEALKSGELKVIANTWTANDWVNNLMDVFSSKWGSSIASMLENLKQTDWGKALVEKLLGKDIKNNIKKKDIKNNIKEKKKEKKVVNKIENTLNDFLKNEDLKNK